MKLKLIDADELRKYWKISKECAECHWNNRDCSMPPYYPLRDICEAIDEMPVIDAIPVEWLLSHIGEFDWREEAVIHDFIWKWEKEQEENNG